MITLMILKCYQIISFVLVSLKCKNVCQRMLFVNHISLLHVSLIVIWNCMCCMMFVGNNINESLLLSYPIQFCSLFIIYNKPDRMGM